jgi:hypothetical protein
VGAQESFGSNQNGNSPPVTLFRVPSFQLVGGNETGGVFPKALQPISNMERRISEKTTSLKMYDPS